MDTNHQAPTFTIISVEGSKAGDFEGGAFTADELYQALQIIEDDAPEGCTNNVCITCSDGGTASVDLGDGIGTDLDAFNEVWILEG